MSASTYRPTGSNANNISKKRERRIPSHGKQNNTEDYDAGETLNEKRHKRNKHNHQGNAEDTSAAGSAVLKKKLRDTERLLRKDKLTATVRQDAERRLKALKMQLEERTLSGKEKEMVTKYRMVKFFERQKTIRKLRRAEKKVEEATDAKAKKLAETELAEVTIDFNYIMHYPRLEKYVSLYPKANADDPVSAEMRRKTREDIRVALESGELTDAWGQDADNKNRGLRSASSKGTGTAKKATETARAKKPEAKKDEFFDGAEDASSDESPEEADQEEDCQSESEGGDDTDSEE